MAIRALVEHGEPEGARSLGQVLEFMRSLWALDHQLQSASKRMEAGSGVTGPQRLVVRIVGRFPGISAGEVSQILHLHPSTLTGILKRLSDRGLVERRADPRDARRVLLHLSARGRGIDEVRSGTVEAAVRRSLQRLRPRTVQAAREAVDAISAELERLA
ncbi:MAG TPA: MarR family transcriptional regulator [Anaeromyxobacteraceae bacterium]|nr:MarR family transcriptional regulator [Anaeromyxobacteraceae bacterium]